MPLHMSDLSNAIRPVAAGIAILRTLVAAYFLAMAAAIFLVPSKVAVLTAWVPDTTALIVSVGLFGLCGLALLMREAVRLAALVLSVAVAGLALMQFDTLSVSQAQEMFVRDMTLLGALFVVSAFDGLRPKPQAIARRRRVEPTVTRFQEGDALRPNAFAVGQWVEERLEDVPAGQPENIFAEETKSPGRMAA